MKTKLVTAPATAPLSVSEAKSHLRVSNSDEDTLIGDLIDAAVAYIEKETNCALIDQTWQVFFDSWPTPVTLPHKPLSSVTHVKTYDDSDTATTYSSSNYYVDTAASRGEIKERTGQTWPTPARVANGIEIQYVAGYGSSASDVPEDLRQAVRLLVGHWFENRHLAVYGDDMTAAELPLSVTALLAPYKS